MSQPADQNPTELLNTLHDAPKKTFEHGKWNHYDCKVCGQTTIAMHEDDGVTPAFISCRATPDCTATAVSRMYLGPQTDDQIPHVVWYRPADEAALQEALQEFPRPITRMQVREHYLMGGCLMREVAKP